MPATFAHPAAVLPLRRFCGRYLNFGALVIGSMMPDFGYFLGFWELATFAHTVVGSALVCVPFGAMLLAAGRLLREPVVQLLPQPHRRALTEAMAHSPRLGVATWLVASFSILVGAWTHCIWDSFTHAEGWSVQRLAPLMQPVLQIGEVQPPGFYLLQHASTIVGTLLLARAYVAWLRSRPAAASARDDSDRWRYVLLARW